MENSRLKTVIIFFALLLVVSPAYSQTSKTAAPVGEPIKIGGSLSLTGYASEQAKWVKAGYESRAEDVNKAGGLRGRPVNLIMYDDRSNPDKAVTFFERAITIDKVDLIFGGCPGMSVVAVMPLAEKYE